MTTLNKRGKGENEAQFTLRIWEEYNTGEWQNWVQAAVTNEAFVQNAQIPLEVYRKYEQEEKPLIVDNETTVLVNRMAQQMTKGDPRFRVAGQDYSDNEGAEVVNDLLEHVFEFSRGKEMVKRVIKDGIITGKSVVRERVDPDADFGRGEILLEPFDPKFHIVSPWCKKVDATDSKHTLLLEEVTYEQLSERFPNLNIDKLKRTYSSTIVTPDVANIEKQQIGPVNNSKSLYRLFERFTKVRVQYNLLYDPTSDFRVVLKNRELDDFLKRVAVLVQTIERLEPIYRESDIQEMLNVYATLGLEETDGVYSLLSDGTQMAGNEYEVARKLEEQGITDLRVVPNSTTKIIIKTFGELLKEKFIAKRNEKVWRVKRVVSVEDEILENEILERTTVPVHCVMFNHQRHPYPVADVTTIRPLQEQLNVSHVINFIYSANLTNEKVFVPRGETKLIADLRERGNKPGFEAFEYEADDAGKNAIIFKPTPQMPPEFYRQKQDLKEQMRRLIGVSPFMEGNTESSPRTQGATIYYAEASKEASDDKRESIEYLLDSVAKGLVEWFPSVYNYYKVIRIVKPNAREKLTEVNKPLIKDGQVVDVLNNISFRRYDVRLVSGSLVPTNKWLKAQYMMELRREGVGGPGALDEEILRNSEIENVDEVLQRADQLSQQQALIEQLQNQLQDTQNQLQRKTTEVVHLMEKSAAEKTTSNLKAIESEVRARGEITKAKLDQAAKLAELEEKLNKLTKTGEK